MKLRREDRTNVYQTNKRWCDTVSRALKDSKLHLENLKNQHRELKNDYNDKKVELKQNRQSLNSVNDQLHKLEHQNKEL